MDKRRSIVGAMISDTAVRGIEVKAVEKGETRNKRVNLLVKPSVYEKVKNKCDAQGVSVNECINQLLEQGVAQQ